MNKYKMMGDKILVKPEERVKSEVIAVVMDEKPNMGTVLAVGPGKMQEDGTRGPMPVAVGQRIRFGTMGEDEYLRYFEFTDNNEKYLVMSWQDVCFVVE
jgi:chaperonin GroES